MTIVQRHLVATLGLLATAAWIEPAEAAECENWAMRDWERVYRGMIPAPGSTMATADQLIGVLMVKQDGNRFAGIMQREYYKVNAEGLEERAGEDGVVTGTIRQSTGEIDFTVDYPVLGTIKFTGSIIDDGRAQGASQTSAQAAADPNVWNGTWHIKAPLACAAPQPVSPFKIDRTANVPSAAPRIRQTTPRSRFPVDKTTNVDSPVFVGTTDRAVGRRITNPGTQIPPDPIRPESIAETPGPVVSYAPGTAVSPLRRDGAAIAEAGSVRLPDSVMKDIDASSWRSTCTISIPLSYVAMPGLPAEYGYTEITMRYAQPWDKACVWRAEAARIKQENETAPQFWVDGEYGPHSCKPGYVWREAVERDDVCVLPERRQAIRDGTNP